MQRIMSMLVHLLILRFWIKIADGFCNGVVMNYY
ncbi:Uncharacterised protein [Klebsiella pneumoniae subsp. pneumoniae]|uniref:Uncharacterized protein n=1 Tax=Klebsiella pneumoniae subsp. pneumoniae TaxID=72407 RepID=A0A377YW73_KLEPN|nr:Uncharacterised protein [Klebsiella pneumoniae subsp. pneumoniae]